MKSDCDANAAPRGIVCQMADHPRWTGAAVRLADNESTSSQFEFEQWRFEQAVRRELSGDD
jgi:hypothetical protein